MARNTSISLGDHFENFVDDKVSTGRFKNASEVIRAGLRLLEEEESKIIFFGLSKTTLTLTERQQFYRFVTSYR